MEISLSTEPPRLVLIYFHSILTIGSGIFRHRPGGNAVSLRYVRSSTSADSPHIWANPGCRRAPEVIRQNAAGGSRRPARACFGTHIISSETLGE